MKFFCLTTTITVILLICSVNISCNEKASDERDKFVGTWTGYLCFARIGTEYFTTVIITKSTSNPAQIILTQQGGNNDTRIGTVNGNSYVYQNFTASLGIAGNYTGSGSINGNIITESGLITSDGAPYQGNLGDWSRNLNKQ